MKRVRKTRDIHAPFRTEQRLSVADNLNPMLNNVILNHLFEVIPFNFNDFKNFRLVSNLWLRESFSRWRKEAWLPLTCGSTSSDNTVPQFLQLEEFMKMLNLRNDSFSLVGKNHYRKYKVSIDHDFPESKQFWNKVGPFMTHLKLSDFTVWKASEAFVQILFEFTPNLTFLSLERNNYQQQTIPISNMFMYPFPPYGIPVSIPSWNEGLRPSTLSKVQRNLTHFEITLNDGDSDRDGFGISWMYFLIRFPNIKVLKLQGFPIRSSIGREEFDEVLKLLTSVKTVRENGGQGCLINLEHLDLLNARWKMQGRFSDRIFSMLKKLEFPLTSLAIDIGYMDKEYTKFERILKLYSKTLQKLTLFRGTLHQPFFKPFPYGVKLPLLTELRLVGRICGDLHFLRNVPQLKTLVLLDGYDEMEPEVLHSYLDYSLERLSDKARLSKEQLPPYRYQDVIDWTDFSAKSMKNLVMPQMEEFIVGSVLCTGEQVNALAKLMPGLKKLRLGLWNDGFRMTCKNWSQLQHLDIQPFDVDEKGFLGIEKGQKYRQPNITDLQQLSYLRMGAHSSDSNKGGLSTNSIVDGMFMVENLKKVKLAVTPKASKNVRELLASKFS